MDDGNGRRSFDYLAFYNHFRSPPEILKQHQSVFVDCFRGCSNVLDIGCGRGEFLELLREAGIPAAGIDTDPDMVKLCRSRGLQVDEADGVAYLEQHEGIDGIFMDQVVEHLEPRYLTRLIQLCHYRLPAGGRIVVKTINPLSLATFTDFYLDMTHTNAIHPEALKFILRHAGFSEIDIRYLARTPCSKRLKKINAGEEVCIKFPEFAVAYNHNVDILNDLLFGAEDYAIVARK
ncbi:class I SAM-dependent methyltransferase [Methanocella arvoryzae]|uniref:class I SAM-dependent methyltransferase n=1 Tax=Methanocella arvoryzae TaxID=1175445 RepID=UPI0000DB1A3A|nr:class I SAM-dependent methyltransferase [Methanocella arvoryzae]